MDMVKAEIVTSNKKQIIKMLYNQNFDDIIKKSIIVIIIIQIVIMLL